MYTAGASPGRLPATRAHTSPFPQQCAGGLQKLQRAAGRHPVVAKMQALERQTTTPAHEGRAPWARERQPPEHLRQHEQPVGARKHQFNDFRSGDLQ